ncbi:carboxylesterase family protein [Pseudenhygromyxa sp. WMMC2535]|uniref:carboxylesterase/lipase family protein n=1 Tax=Pseudenhygromyxa sp. WMMC2535 TaxID=2712867 RepID=UPI0015580D99|nr:carboxylesterase family protein [Pseudenhygromyxa sp. WMMC2535]NVB37430.1 carboxylesterase family protein [Pseudenhygromyxa sp. WMMC2535]
MLARVAFAHPPAASPATSTVALAAALALACLGLACSDDGGQSSADGGDEIDTGNAESAESSEGEGTGDSGTEGGLSCEEDPAQTTIQTTYGPVAGGPSEVEGIVRFSNIPYAAPPVGALRFAFPQAPEPWTEPRDATSFGPECVQLAVSGSDPTTTGDEDCLQLNLWSPEACEGADRPVMVFIHGGGNAVGSAVNPLYDGAILAASQGAVVVTLNYRLGALGWYAPPDLGVPSNNALRDQIFALEWVHDNIARFGGDPGQVMIFGESAGAVNTCALVGSPAAAGLFRAAIVQSGTCDQRGLASIQDMSETLEDSLGCQGDDAIACLQATPAAEIMFAEPNGYPEVAGIGRGWGPAVDGDVLPQTTLEALSAGEVDAAFVVGSNRDETFRDTPSDLSEAQYEALVAASFSIYADEVLAAYPVADYDSPSAAWASLTTDLKFICNARRAAEAAAEGGTPSWRYQFSYDDYTVLPGVEQLAFHGLELVYLFGNFATLFEGFEYQPNAGDLEIAATLQDAWGAFAAGEDFPGPVYQAGVDPYLELDVPTGEGQGLRTQQCDFWAQWQ